MTEEGTLYQEYATGEEQGASVTIEAETFDEEGAARRHEGSIQVDVGAMRGLRISVDVGHGVLGHNDFTNVQKAALTDALFEALAAIADLEERLVGGAQRPGVSTGAVVESVRSAYDLEGATETLKNTRFERDGHRDPAEWAVSDLVREDRDVCPRCGDEVEGISRFDSQQNTEVDPCGCILSASEVEEMREGR